MIVVFIIQRVAFRSLHSSFGRKGESFFQFLYVLQPEYVVTSAIGISNRVLAFSFGMQLTVVALAFIVSGALEAFLDHSL